MNVSRGVPRKSLRANPQAPIAATASAMPNASPVPRPACQPAKIIAVADNVEQIGQYQVVVLNRGGNDGLTPGAVLAIDQLGAVVRDKYGSYPWKKKAFAKEVRLPSERAGTLIVFKVFDRISYGLVIGASGPMRVADRVYNP